VYVRQHSALEKQHPQLAVGTTGAGSQGRSAAATLSGKSGARRVLAANTHRLTGEAWHHALAAECAALLEQCQAADEQLHSDVAASDRRAAVAAAHLPVLEHGNELLWPHGAEVQQEASQQ
jgi:hypothetical protein